MLDSEEVIVETVESVLCSVDSKVKTVLEAKSDDSTLSVDSWLNEKKLSL